MKKNFLSNKIYVDKYLDLTKLHCPVTILKFKQAMRGLTAKQNLNVKISSLNTLNEIYNFCKISGFYIQKNIKHDSYYYLIVAKSKES